RMVETVPGLRVSAAGPDDAGGPAEEAGRRPLRAHREGEGRGRVAFRDAGPETADGRGHAERDAVVRLVPGRPEPFRSVEDCPVPRQDHEHRGAPRRPRRDWQVVAFDGFSSEASPQPPMLAARFFAQLSKKPSVTEEAVRPGKRSCAVVDSHADGAGWH